MTAHAPSGRLTIALDAMGGDKAPGMVIAGAEIARQRHPDVCFLIFGDETVVGPLLSRQSRLAACSTVVHTTEVITNDTRPSAALRAGPHSPPPQAHEQRA